MRKSLLPLLLLPLLLGSCHVARFFYWNFSDIHDNEKFDNVKIDAPPTAFEFKTLKDPSSYPIADAKLTIKGKQYGWEEALEKWHTVAFIIIRNDTILYENYFDGYDESVPVPSFSMAKSVVSALVGIAISEGHIGSVDEPITKYLSELRDREGFDRITIRHLLNMRSGIAFNESYNSPFSDVAKYYYGTDIKKYVRKLKVERPPDEVFRYISLNTQLLAMVLEEATGKSLPALAEEKLWRPLGMESDASWSVDSKKNGQAKAFCCLNATARDFAKFGLLYLQNGRWQGKQVVPADWVYASTHFDTALNDMLYKYQWWHFPDFELLTDSSDLSRPHIIENVRITDSTGYVRSIVYDAPDFYAQGHLGQYIYVHPQTNTVMVRLGSKDGDLSWIPLMRKLAEIKLR